MLGSWRLIAVFAGGAFALSVLTALVSGVPFGALVVRALIGAVVFAALGAGVQLVVDRYLPELEEGADGDGSQSAAAQESPDNTPTPGGNVDIVVEEEAGELEEEEPAQDSDEHVASGTDGGSGSESAEEPADLEAADDHGAETGSRRDGNVVAASSENEGGDELIEEVEEVSAAESGSNESVETPPHDRAGSDARTEDIDSLPDVAGLSDGFEESSASGDEAAQRSGEGAEGNAFGGTSSGSSRRRGDQDPETMARAIQTALGRDK